MQNYKRKKIFVLVVNLCGLLNCTYMFLGVGGGVGSYSVALAGLGFPECDKQVTDSWQFYLSPPLWVLKSQLVAAMPASWRERAETRSSYASKPGFELRNLTTSLPYLPALGLDAYSASTLDLKH